MVWKKKIEVDIYKRLSHTRTQTTLATLDMNHPHI